jgi:hypothetical protein
MASFPIYHPVDNWKIYYDMYLNGTIMNSGIYWTSYKHKSSAVRAAKRQFDNRASYTQDGIITYKWIVGQNKPEKGEYFNGNPKAPG